MRPGTVRDPFSHIHSMERAVGRLLTRFEGVPRATEHALQRLLVRAEVFESLPFLRPDAPILDRLPWHALAAFQAPPSEPPAGFEGSWPQPSLLDARFPPSVLHVETTERQLHIRNNVTRYLGQLVLHTPRAALRALTTPRLLPVSDDEISHILSATSLSQLISETLDPADLAFFSKLIQPGRQERYAKLDFSAMESFGPTVPGVYVASTVTLLEQEPKEQYRVVAIRVGDSLFQPSDGAAWLLARYFVLQGAQWHLPMHRHPRLHFPYDTINAVTRTLLPRGHVVTKLLWPHLQHTQGLHEGVIYHRRSVMHNSQREIFTPFPFQTSSIYNSVAVGLQGIAGNSSYPPFLFDPDPPTTPTMYGRYQRDWYQAIYRFVSQVVAEVSPGDIYVARWADAIQKWLPGFPGSGEIFRHDTLARSLTSYLCVVSVFHTADHHSYATIPLQKLPWRIRVPPPDRLRPSSLNLEDLVSPEDFFRAQLFFPMFIRPTILESLRDVDYGFRSTRTAGAAADLHRSLDKLDATWQGTTFPASWQVSSSLQY